MREGLRAKAKPPPGVSVEASSKNGPACWTDGEVLEHKSRVCAPRQGEPQLLCILLRGAEIPIGSRSGSGWRDRGAPGPARLQKEASRKDAAHAGVLRTDVPLGKSQTPAEVVLSFFLYFSSPHLAGWGKASAT